MRRTAVVTLLLVGLSGAARAADLPLVEAAVEPVRPVTVMVEADLSFGQRTYGSGFLISSDGLVATCQHVVARAQEVSVYYRNKERIRAKVIAADADLDVAVLRLDGNRTYPTVQLGDSDLDVIEGTQVGLCGYPVPKLYFSLGMGLDSTTTSGTVSGLRLGDRAENRSRNSVVQLDLEAWRGNSGGPVFLVDGSQVIGLLVSGVNDAINFAIPVNQLKAFLASKSINLKIAPVKADDTATLTVEPGTVDTLVTIRDDRELATSFVSEQRFVNTEALEDQADLTSKFFVPAFGYLPSVHPWPTVEGRDLFFGGLDAYARCVRQRRLGSQAEWEVQLDYPVYNPVAIDKDNVVVGAGRLSYNWSAGQLGVGTAVLRSLLGGMFSRRARIQRQLNTEGCIYVLDRDDGRLKAQLDTAFPNTPVVKDGVAYIGALGQLLAMEVETGSAKWTIGDQKAELESRTWYVVSLGSDGNLYTLETPIQLAVRSVAGNNYFYLEAGVGKSHDDRTSRGHVVLRCRNPQDGKVQWEAPVFNPRDYLRPLASALVIADDAKLAWCRFGPAVAAVDLTARKVVWPEARQLDQTLDKMNKVCWDRRLKAEEQQDPDEALVFTSYSSGVSHGLAVANGRIYYGSYDLDAEGSDRSYVVVAKADTGEEVKRLPCPGRPTPPLIHDGLVLFGASHTGRVRRGQGEPESWLYCYNENTLEEIWRLRVANGGFSYAPQIVGRTLCFSDGKQFYSLALPER